MTTMFHTTRWLRAFLALAAVCSMPTRGSAQEQPLKTIKLEAPTLDQGMSVLQALKNRKSVRELSDQALSRRQLSELLWAADGVNREGGERTAPSALRKYPVDIYVVLPAGVYVYEPVSHQLTLVTPGDHRKQAGSQDWERNAPVNLVYVADTTRFDDPNNGAGTIAREDRLKWSAIEAGCQAQNVYLYCASAGLGATVRVSATTEAFGKAVPLRPSQVVLCGQTVGVPRAK